MLTVLRLLIFVIILSSAALASPLPSLGDDKNEVPILTLDPPPVGWQVLRDSPANSSNSCIGKINTPECTVITEIACRLWHRIDPCYLTRFAAQWNQRSSLGPPPKHIQYKIIESRPFGRSLEFPDGRLGDLEGKAESRGATWRVVIAERDCDLSDGLCETGGLPPKFYYLAKRRRGWSVVFFETVKTLDPSEPCEVYSITPISPTPEVCQDDSRLNSAKKGNP